MQQTPEMIYVRNLPQIKPQYVPNTLHHRYGVVPVEKAKTENYIALEQKAQTHERQNTKEQGRLEQTLKMPARTQTPMFEVRKGWDEHNQKEVPIVYIFNGSELETKLMERYGNKPKDFFYTEIHYTEGFVYEQRSGRTEKRTAKQTEENKDKLIQAYFNQLMIQLTQQGQNILKNNLCRNCNMPTDEDICNNCGMVQN